MKYQPKYDYYVGIDYSMTSPGVCVFDHSNYEQFKPESCIFHYVTEKKSKVVECDFIKGLHFANWLDDLDRYRTLAAWVLDIVPRASYVLIENYSYGSRGNNFNVGENTAILKDRLRSADIDFDVVDLTGPKKMACGTGNATKEDMEAAFIRQTGINLQDIFKVSAIKDKSPVYDLIDAYYIAEYAFCTQEVSLWGYQK